MLQRDVKGGDSALAETANHNPAGWDVSRKFSGFLNQGAHASATLGHAWWLKSDHFRHILLLLAMPVVMSAFEGR